MGISPAVTNELYPIEDKGAYMEAVQMLYSIAYTIKMSKKGDHCIEGYFDFVVPPLEGFWWEVLDGKAVPGFSYGDKAQLHWSSLIRLPEFVTKEEFEWAVSEASDVDYSNRHLRIVKQKR